MSLHKLACQIYLANKDDEASMDELRCERKRLSKAMMLDGAASLTITSATMNGQSFSGLAGLTPKNRLDVLSRVLAFESAGAAASSTTTPIL